MSESSIAGKSEVNRLNGKVQELEAGNKELIDTLNSCKNETGNLGEQIRVLEKKVKQHIIDNNAYALKNLEFKAKMISKEGALEFWSSGGLLHSPQQNDKVRKFETFNTHPKHIKVIEINATTAVAMYYVEGDYQEKESENNGNTSQ